MNKKNAIIVLEDGGYFRGTAFGAAGETAGEVVFNTSMTGYQEILTDPSYAGQIITMTCPMIGNYGVNGEDNESRKPFLSGFVVKEVSNIYSNWRAEESLDDLLAKHNVIGIQNIDTRALTRKIRDRGAMKAIISTVTDDIGALLRKVKSSPGLVGRDLVKEVTVEKEYGFGKNDNKYKIVAFDFGIKQNILNQLVEKGFTVEVVPAFTEAKEIMKKSPDGIFLSNGPGDPEAVTYAVQTIKGLLGKFPVFGICLGHQLLALALGGKTYKLKFGHHGANHPVKNLSNGRVEITAQNHGFAVDTDTLPGTVKITHVNLNDQTVEGLRCLDLPAFSVQYHPEASPGPHDSAYLFKDFIKLIDDFRG